MATPPPAPPPDPSEGPLAPDELAAIVGELDAAERGFVLGVLLAGSDGGRGTPTTSLLEAPSRERCAEALGAIGRLARAGRVRLTRALARDVVPAFPAGIEEVDAAFLRAILDDEAPAIVDLVGRDAPPAVQAAASASLERRAAASRSAGGDCDRDTDLDADTDPGRPGAFATAAQARADRDPRRGEAVPAQPATLVMRAVATRPARDVNVSSDLLAELQRAVLAQVVTVPPLPAGGLPQSWTRRLTALPARELVTHLTRRGAEVVGLSLRWSSGEILLRSAALVGAPFAEWMLAAGRRGPGRDSDLGLDRAGARTLVAATRPAPDPRETLARVGARAVGARLISPSERGLGGIDMVTALAQRLPPGIAAELLAAAGAEGRGREG